MAGINLRGTLDHLAPALAALAMLAATAGCIVRRDARRLADDRAQPRPHPPLMP